MYGQQVKHVIMICETLCHRVVFFGRFGRLVIGAAKPSESQ